MNQTRHSGLLAGPFIMFISAAVFGYFGFASTFAYHSATTGQLLVYVPILEWTLKGSAIAFLLSAVLTFGSPLWGNMIYGAAGFISAVLFLVVAGLDLADTQHTVMSPILLVIFAAWNGYGSWSGLRAVMSVRRAARGNETPVRPP